LPCCSKHSRFHAGASTRRNSHKYSWCGRKIVRTPLPDEKLQGNQCLLIVGISQSLKEADAAHPYGYATERYVWSLISGSSPFILPQHAPRPTSNPWLVAFVYGWLHSFMAGCIRLWLVAFVHLRPKNIAYRADKIPRAISWFLPVLCSPNPELLTLNPESSTLDPKPRILNS
jgi:hypothetical protein